MKQTEIVIHNVDDKWTSYVLITAKFIVITNMML